MEPVTRRMFMTTAGAAPLVAGVGAYALWNNDDGGPPRFEPPEPARVALQRRRLPNVPLVTHEGERVRFYDDLVKDRKVVLTFVSSGAAAQSATVRQNLAALQRAFGARVGKDLFLYSI